MDHIYHPDQKITLRYSHKDDVNDAKRSALPTTGLTGKRKQKWITAVHRGLILTHKHSINDKIEKEYFALYYSQFGKTTNLIFNHG